MPRERLRDIIERTQKKIYVSHPWDEWLAIALKAYTDGYPLRGLIPKVLLKTALGLEVSVEVLKLGKYDWWDKLITSNCDRCPLYVPDQIDGENQLSKLTLASRRYNGKLTLRVPENTQGVCLFGRSIDNSRLIPKFLTENKGKPLRACNIKQPERSQRASLLNSLSR
ncbi:MAG: hypothetical protein C4584_02085 [Armatimonadetes bacterium]|nr:MAG: hypothetical protein C4584_02085 [Armatimonadota bacterium]